MQYPEDAPGRLREMATELEFNFPMCYDETQAVAKAYQAACTPDFFLFDKSRKLVYRGQLDGSRPATECPSRATICGPRSMRCCPASRSPKSSGPASGATLSGSRDTLGRSAENARVAQRIPPGLRIDAQPVRAFAHAYARQQMPVAGVDGVHFAAVASG